MKQQNEKPQRINKPSTLLSQDENDTVFSLLGRRCQVSFVERKLNFPHYHIWCPLNRGHIQIYQIRYICLLAHLRL